MEGSSHTFQFKDKVPLPKFGIALMFDIGGFSRFFSQHDVEFYVPRFLNHVFRCVGMITHGGTAKWLSNPYHALEKGMPPWSETPTTWSALPSPIHSKYLGDGALYIWELGNSTNALSTEQVQELFYRVSVMEKAFPMIMAECADDIPVADIPTNIRFGMSAGAIYRLNYAYTTQAEYMGYAINLASRLQKYCKDIGFIASARVEVNPEQLDRMGFIKLVAKNLRGFSSEVVVVAKKDYEALSEDTRNLLFAPTGFDRGSTLSRFPFEKTEESISERLKKGKSS